MTPSVAGFPFQVNGDTVSTILGFLPLIVLIIVMVGLMMWALAFFSRYFEYLKTQESAWLDRTTLDFVRRVLEAVWIGFMAIIVLAAAQTYSTPLRDALAAGLALVPAIFFFVFVMFAAAVIVRMLHRFAGYLRGELRTKPKRVAPPTALALAEVVLKYVVYIVALVIAVLGGISALPPGDRAAIYSVVALPAFSPAAALEIGIGIVVVLIADRFVESIFEDLKKRTKKFTALAFDEFKALARYAVWLFGAAILLFIFLALVLPEGELIVFAVGFVAFLLLLAVLAFEPARNALAGLALMRSDPFDVGDRIRVQDGLVADVVSMSLTATQVRSLRGELVRIPNDGLLGSAIVNFTRSKPYAVVLDVSVDFGVDHDRVRDLLLQAAAQTAGVVKNHPPEVLGEDVVGDSIRYELRAFTEEPERMSEIKSALVWKVQDLFAAAGLRPRP